MTFNKAQRQALIAWPQLLQEFLANEWLTGALGYGSGALAGALATFIWNDAWQWALNDKQLTNYRKLVEAHIPNLWFILAPFALIVLVKTASIALRAARSWALGVTSGAFFWPFAVAIAAFGNLTHLSVRHGLVALGISFGALLLGFVLRLLGRVVREATPGAPEKQLERRRGTSHSGRDQESPIESWDEDTLGRSSLVETLVLHILVSKTPVIALRGDFGDGKSSVLNLLRLQLGGNAIVVSFSSWLPDSQQTLVRDLFGDIAAEVEHHFIVPELRKRLYKFASLLGGTVPYLKSLPDILSPYTQREEIRDLGQVLSRIPKRVVVLLDEIDRMQKDEVLTLLKVIRGVSTLPNLTFVCAFQQEEFDRTACGDYDARSHEFMEKFFPTAVDLPKPSPETLERTLRDRVIGSLEMAEWFTGVEDRAQFAKRLSELWGKALGLVCTNIRKIGLVANDLHAAALLVRREVDPLDLCTLEVVRRFYPTAHELIWMNPSFFCRSGDWWKSRSFQPEEMVAAQTQKIAAAVKAISEEADTGAAIYPLLVAMFPRREKELMEGRPQRARGDEFSSDDEKGKRIAHPDYFPVYFHREVPQTVFSSLEMDKFTEELKLAKSDPERRSIFRRCFSSLEVDSLRRYDFIHKVGLDLETLPITVARSVAFAIAGNAESLGNEFLISERRRALAAVLAVAQRLSGSEEINVFICDCIAMASTDVFAADLFRSMTDRRESNKVVLNFSHVRESEIANAFAGRMERKYGPNADVVANDISKLQVYPFWLWASMGSPEREKVISFWTRYIGNRRRRLAEVFNVMAPAGTMWTKEGPEYIDRMIPTATLRHLYAEAVSDETLERPYEAAIDRLRRFLSGDLKNGEILSSSPSVPDPEEPTRQ